MMETKENSALIQDVTGNRDFTNSIVLKSTVQSLPLTEWTKIPVSYSEFFSKKITKNSANLGIQFYQRNYELCYKLIEKQ